MSLGEWMVMEEIADINAVGSQRPLSLKIPLKQMLIILRQSHHDNTIIKILIQINGLRSLFTILPDGFTKRDLLTRHQMQLIEMLSLKAINLVEVEKVEETFREF